MDTARVSMSVRARLGAAAAILTVVAAANCASSANNGSLAPAGALNGGSASGSGANGGTESVSGSSSSSAGEGASTLPPEMKLEANFQSPVATGTVVWVANPSSGRVAYIDATTFAVKTVLAGSEPTVLAAIPDPTDANDIAIVLNEGSLTANLYKLARPADGGADIDGTLTTQTFGSMPPNANAWAISPSGRWAIAWTNTSAGLVPNLDPLDGYGAMTIIDVTGQLPPAQLTQAGYQPVQIAFAGDAYAYVVTQDGIAVIDLLEGMATVNYPLLASDAGAADAQPPSGDDAGSDGGDASAAVATADAGASSAPDVSFTSDGAYALIRQDGVQSITVIALATGASTLVPLPAEPTDLTLSPTGTFAVAVLRDTSTVVTLPLPGIATDPTSYTTTTIPGQTIGRAIVTPGGQSALLFTTAAPVDALTVLSFQPAPAYKTIALHAPVLAVFPTPDGEYAVVLHQITSTAQDQGAFSVVPIGADLLAANLPASIATLQAPPSQVALTDDQALISVTATNGPYAVYRTAMPSFDTSIYSLASAPLALGLMPGGLDGGTASANAYVSQDYPDGRITFIDLVDDDGGARTITGFDLSAGIVEGPEQ